MLSLMEHSPWSVAMENKDSISHLLTPPQLAEESKRTNRFAHSDKDIVRFYCYKRVACWQGVSEQYEVT